MCVPEQCLIAKVDFESDYIKEYWKKLNKNIFNIF